MACLYGPSHAGEPLPVGPPPPGIDPEVYSVLLGLVAQSIAAAMHPVAPKPDGGRGSPPLPPITQLPPHILAQ